MYQGRITNCATRIVEGLRRKGMTQMQLSKITKIPKSSICNYIRGDFEPKQDRIDLISRALDVSEAWLLGYDVPPEREAPSREDPEISAGERVLLDLFRRVPEDQQKLVLQMIRAALGSQE